MVNKFCPPPPPAPSGCPPIPGPAGVGPVGVSGHRPHGRPSDFTGGGSDR